MAAQTQQTQPLQDDEELCTIEASVVTGFEESARGEAKEKFNVDVKAVRGRITWKVPLNKVNDVLKMGSVDNCKVVVHTVPCFHFTDQHDSLARLQKMVKDIDWEIGLRAWQHVYAFPYPIASRPDVIPSDEDLMDVVIITNLPPPKDKSAKKDKKKGRWGKKKDKIKELKRRILQSKLDDSFQQSPRSPVNEKGDADVKKESDLLASHDEEVGLTDENDLSMSKKDDGSKVNRLAASRAGQHLLKLDSARTLDNHSKPAPEEGGESLRQHNLASEVNLTAGISDEATKQAAMSFTNNSLSPGQGSSADSSLSPVGKKISESEFASIVISRLTSPREPAPAEDGAGGVSPKMSCVTPPPTPIRSIDNPFSNLQGRLTSELLPFLDNSKLPERGDSIQGSRQDKDDNGGIIDAKLPFSAGTAQIESISVDETSSNMPNVPSLSTLATSASTPKTSSSAKELAEDSTNSRQQEDRDKSLEGNDSSKTYKRAAVKKEPDPTKPKFRVTCFRTGDTHAFDSTSAAASFGSALVAYFGWQVDLKNFDLEVILNIDNEEVTVSLALTKMSLHYRNLVAFGPTTLRATICYNMLRLCRIKNGDFVCDPMCGTCAIPIEGALNWVNCFHFGGDIHEKAIERTILNIAAIQEKQKQENKSSLKLDVLQWDIQHLPLRDRCVDVFVSDVPFGHRMGSRSVNPALYSSLLSEMARTARLGARACLLTEDRSSLIKAIQNLGRYWQRRLILNVNIGGLNGYVFLLTRTNFAVAPSSTSWRGDEGQIANEGQDGDELASADSRSVTDSSVETRTETE
ncbi:unnamed protein product [Candidula unifasciata]|uniref:THUMP domain-containing protein n=1 Tax=Candidula unifasciata TaxID=100452 RepID=A0A8S3YC20_9EUPU|nr:unnamed protein product [Candidula unifasciata]